MILVFKTNCNEAIENIIIPIISECSEVNNVNFDFEDCDKILRVDVTEYIAERISSLVKNAGYNCEELYG
jgi:hypothetical protein